MHHNTYLMENEEEILRQELKTDCDGVVRQAAWAGIRPGMRVADLGCGSGKTTFCLKKLVGPAGTVVGVDLSAERIGYAEKQYGGEGIEFHRGDIREPLDDLGQFDFVWLRFVLEYHRERSRDIVRNVSRMLRPGGILCLIDLDYNCLNHYGLSPRLEQAIDGVLAALETHRDFDPYAGRKLYSFLYDLGYREIDADVACHHLIFGELREKDAFNWMKKVEVAVRRSGYRFEEYGGGFEEFRTEFTSFFTDPRRFTYTPVIACRGSKPAA
ncbi:MAG TPA: methyltransferase domain-containing protein [Geobacteraceae bacterium]|nr:methyltransferase domain-containing protein [Geobacteraceae bacterium]